MKHSLSIPSDEVASGSTLATQEITLESLGLAPASAKQSRRHNQLPARVRLPAIEKLDSRLYNNEDLFLDMNPQGYFTIAEY